MRVLITGGAGFIGSHSAEHHAKMGNEIIVFDNLSRAEILGKSIGDPLYNWNYLRNNYHNIKLVKGDVRNFNELKIISKGVDVIIHTAAQGTFNVLEVARLLLALENPNAIGETFLH